MIKERRVLALIPARGGSKGIKDKNITLLAGKPLINYTIAAALESQYVDRVIVSTDAERIAEVARDAGADVPFLRPAELASDTAKSIDAVLHCLEFVMTESSGTSTGSVTEESVIPSEARNPYDILVLLQPTSPLRTAADIDAALETFLAHDERGLCSVNLVDDHPILTRTLDEDGVLQPLMNNDVRALRQAQGPQRAQAQETQELHALGPQETQNRSLSLSKRPQDSTVRRQDMPEYYHVNGAIYINRVEEITRETSFNDNPGGYVMPKERSVDIDDVVDLAVAEALLC